MKPTVFIASSTQASARMHQVARWVEGWGLEPRCWDDVGVFQPGDVILARLLALAEEVDAALILFGDEDRDWYRPEAQPQPRDNVLVEYGIFASRLGRERTIVIRTGDPRTPSDLGGLIFVQLDPQPPSTPGKQPLLTEADRKARRRLKDWATKLPELIVRARQVEEERRRAAEGALASGVDAEFALDDDRARTIAIVTGGFREVRDVDVVVSSENTDLQPARYFDRSTSAMLRYLDADRNPGDLRVRRDAYFESLKAACEKDQVQVPVLPGAVLPAPTTGLRAQGIKYVFHAAVVRGIVGGGYEFVQEELEEAVRNCFRRFDQISVTDPLRSMLFPLFGTGTGRLGAEVVAPRLLRAIHAGMVQHPAVARVEVLAYIDAHRRALRSAATALGWRALP